MPSRHHTGQAPPDLAKHRGQARLRMNNAHSLRISGCIERSSDKSRPVESSAVPENLDRQILLNTSAGNPVAPASPARDATATP
ncbi:hypothetical protein GCM10010452_03480 [Crossiella cryophila]